MSVLEELSMCSSHCIASIASSFDEDEDEVVWGESVPLPPPAPLIDDEQVLPPELLLVLLGQSMPGFLCFQMLAHEMLQNGCILPLLDL